MSEEQLKNLQAGAALEGLEEELSVEELKDMAGGIQALPSKHKALNLNIQPELDDDI
jgi:hypothetical protein